MGKLKSVLFVAVTVFIFCGILAIQAEENKKPAEKPTVSDETKKEIEKKLTDKESDVASCAKSVFKKEKAESYSISVVIEIGPSKKIGKKTFSPGGKTDEYKAFAKCVENKFKGITFPDVGKATIKMNRNYNVVVKTEKQ